jgi:hypothetical protein
MTDEELVEILNDFETKRDDSDLINVLHEFENDTKPNKNKAIYEVKNIYTSFNRKFEITTKTINITLGTAADSFQEANVYVDYLFQKIYDDHVKNVNPNTKVRMVVFHDLFLKPCSTHLIEKNQFTPGLIKNIFTNVVQSRKATLDEAISITNNMRIVLTISKVLKGGHRGKPGVIPSNNEKPENVIDLHDYCKDKRSVVALKKSKFCLVQAILIAKAFHNKEKNARRLHNSTIKLKQMVNKIVKDLRLPNEDLGITHLRRIEEYLKDYNIVCFQGGDRQRQPCYFNPDNRRTKFLYILHHEDHFYCIKAICAYFNCSYFCPWHNKRYSNIGFHKCEYLCQICYRQKCLKSEEIKCKCSKVANNPACLKLHKALSCFKEKICKKCNHLINSKKHVCLNEKYCHNCKKPQPLDHKCHILSYDQVQERDKNKREKKFNGLVFFDFEAYKCPESDNHIVNLAMAQKVCLNCIQDTKRCEKCKIKVIKRNISDFVSWMLMEENQHFIFIAHNMKV